VTLTAGIIAAALNFLGRDRGHGVTCNRQFRTSKQDSNDRDRSLNCTKGKGPISKGIGELYEGLWR
jgi:hypothetical protein